jgi:hypothetical protein
MLRVISWAQSSRCAAAPATRLSPSPVTHTHTHAHIHTHARARVHTHTRAHTHACTHTHTHTHTRTHAHTHTQVRYCHCHSTVTITATSSGYNIDTARRGTPKKPCGASCFCRAIVSLPLYFSTAPITPLYTHLQLHPSQRVCSMLSLRNMLSCM